MLTTIISGYHFISLTAALLAELQENFLVWCQQLALKGTILLSPEGININVAGSQEHINAFIAQVHTDVRFSEMSFHRGETADLPFAVLKVKIKKEIITLRAPTIRPEINRAPCVSPEEFKEWLDAEQDITVLDTRNDFEVRFGTFKNAINLSMHSFTDFKNAAKALNPNKKVVMFCTGGIRCEKAALHLQQEGFSQVFQLQSGILGYFKKIGGAHYEGDCFVFDTRVSVTPEMKVSGKMQCKTCYGPVGDEGCCV